MGGARHNLVLVSNPIINERADFEAIATTVNRLDPTIRARVFDHIGTWDASARIGHQLRRLRLAARPTLVVAPHRDDGFAPWRGVLCSGNRMSKPEEAERLRSAAIPVPEHVVWSSDEQPSIDHLGAHVVVKPATGTQSQGVALVRSGDVTWRRFEGEYVGTSDQMIVQRFIDTDPAPSYYRVLTFFGAPLMCERIRLLEDQRPVRGPDPVEWRILPRGDDTWKELVHEDGVVALAARAANAFPEVPLCGVDVVLEASTGKFYVLEMNTWGYVWYLSSPRSPADNEKYGLDVYGQYGALDVAARQLVTKTRELLG